MKVHLVAQHYTCHVLNYSDKKLRVNHFLKTVELVLGMDSCIIFPVQQYFRSNQNDEKMMMKGYVQWNPLCN